MIDFDVAQWLMFKSCWSIFPFSKMFGSPPVPVITVQCKKSSVSLYYRTNRDDSKVGGATKITVRGHYPHNPTKTYVEQ